MLLLHEGCGVMASLGGLAGGDILPERVAHADIIIVGKLLDVNERAVVEEERRRNGPYYYTYTYYDIGKVSVLEVLKGKFGKEEIFVKFPSFDQTQPAQLKIDCRHFSVHDIWKPGVWLIEVDSGREPEYLVRRGNYVPSGRRGDVMKIIEEHE